MTGALDIIMEAMDPLRGRIVLDVGCGAGRLARPLAAPGAPLVVIELRVDGALAEAVALIDDDTEAREAAQAALVRAVADERLIERRAFGYDRTESWPDIGAFLFDILRAEPARAEAAAGKRYALRDAFARLSRLGGRGRALARPMRARILRTPARGATDDEGRRAR